MKAFENKTNTGTEPAVKKGIKLPEDAVNIGYFSSQEVTPERHLSVTDLSSLIPENSPSGFASEVDTIMYADEFGVLRYAKTNAEAGQYVGSPIVNNSQVSLSNKIMNFSEEEINYNFTGRETEFESKFFVHSYYVSTHYALLSPNVSEYSGIDFSSELRNPAQYNIRVVDESGKENQDIKYKILLEKYSSNSKVPSMAGTNYESLDLYRIIVLLEKADPNNLYLMYDKYEKDEDNIPYNPFFNYKEKINSVPYFNYVAEESEVIDASSQNKRVYSTQIFSYKENDLLNTKISNDGWKIYTPRKAIQDPRTFQSFNWRLIAKINYDFSQTRNIYSNDERPVMNVGVLYSGSIAEAKNAYVFNNMQESVFNIQNYIFKNPNAQAGINESQKSYWLVNIDDLGQSYSNYDLLIWTPTRSVTDNQARTIERILSQNISIFVDMSALNSVDAEAALTNFGFQNLDIQNSNSGLMTIDEAYKNANTTMNAWSLSEYNEENSSLVPTYSLFGTREDALNNYALRPVPTFVGTISTESSSTGIIKIGNNSAIIKKSIQRAQLLPSFFMITAAPFLQLVNDKISADGTQTSNNGETNIYEVGTIGSQRITGISQIVVGPNKLFYNILSDINKTKVNNYSSQNTSNNSTTLWSVSPWESSWVINGENRNGSITVLSEAEKLEYNFGFKTAIGSSTAKFSRQILPSLKDKLYRDFERTSNGPDLINIIKEDLSNVDFYLESTNENVDFINFNTLSTLSDEDKKNLGAIGSNYNLFKLSDAAKSQIASAPLSLDATSKVISSELNLSLGYPYIITSGSHYQDRTGNTIRTPNDFLPGSQDVKNYSFSLSTQINVNQITQTSNTYKIEWSSPFSSVVKGEGDFTGYIIEKGGISGSLARTEYSVAQSDENLIEIDKLYSPFNDYKYPSRIFSRTDIRSIDQDSTSSSLNNFHYTGDIDAGNRWDEYRVNYDSGTSQTTVSEVPQSVTYGAFFSRVYKGNKLTANDIYQAFIDPNFSWKVFFGQSCLTHPVWYKDVEPEEFFILPYSITRFTRKPITLVKYVLNKIHPPSTIPKNTIEDPFNLVDSSSKVATFFEETYNTRTKKLQLAQLIMSRFSRDYYFVTQEAPTVTSANEKYYSSSSGSDYIRYIQYTLSKQKYPITVSGKYDRNTHLQVKNFQSAKSQSFVDGIVDSETKSVLATYWLNLYKNDINRFNSELNAAPAQSKKYISSAVQYSDIANIGIPGKEYRRISFTGVPGPTELVDYIICKVPQVATGQKVHSVTVKTGGWSTVVESVHLYEQDFNVQAFFTNTAEGAKIPNARSRVSWYPGDQSVPANSSKLINFDTYNGVENIKYIMIKVKSKKLPSKYGPNAEGFSISDITFSLSADGTAFPPKYGGKSEVSALVNGTIKGYTEIQSSDQKALNLATVASAIQTANSVTSLEVNQISLTVSNSGVSKTIVHTVPSSEKERVQKTTDKYSFKESYGSDNTVIITVDPVSQLSSVSPTISKSYVLSSNAAQQETSSANFSISSVAGRSNLYVIKTTNGLEYTSTESSPITVVENFYLADPDASNIATTVQNRILTVNIRDGVVLLTDSVGRPTGFPNFNAFPSSSIGFLNLLWSQPTLETPSELRSPPAGLDWQFVHRNPNTKQLTFLGRKISYLEYMQKNGASDIFIAVNATDADGVLSDPNNIIGEANRSQQLQITNRPSRYLCPVYSVKVANRPKVAVSGPSSNLSKFDTWYINLTQGKFIKKITVPVSYNFTNWIKEYKGKELKCYYDTTKIKTPYSSIFGFGYYDIYEENPRIISDDQIKLRYGKVHSVQEQYDKQLLGLIVNGSTYTDASPIVPWIKIEVKNQNGKWIEVPRKEIRSFDKHNGTIIFKKEIVPLQEKDIRVSYTIKNDSAMLHQINGQKLEINPYNGLSIDKPIFIYLLPVRCEEIVNGVSSEAQGFTNLGPIHFTYDSSIFNINTANYNPFALHISTIQVNNLYNFNNVKVEDMRVRGGGIRHSVDIVKEYESNKDILSFADIYSGKGFLHANGGYVIVKIPKEVINNFNSKEDVYNIVRNNLTAGVSFDIQDVDGTDWRSIINVE